MLSLLRRLSSVTLNKEEAGKELVERVNKLLVRARYEFHSPPVNFNVKISSRVKSMKFKYVKGEGNIVLPTSLVRDEEFDEIVLWFFRHILSHIHYCPYDMKTAYELQKLAFKECDSWDLAYISLYFLSELQIDLVYLPLKYGEIPGHLLYRFRDRPYGVHEILYSSYKRAYSKYLGYYKLDPLIEDYGRQLLLIVSRLRPWSTKIRMIASLLSRLRQLRPRIFSKRAIRAVIKESIIPVKEDVTKEGLKSLTEVYGGVRDIKTAKSFYEQWVQPRLKKRISKEQVEKLMKQISQRMKTKEGKREGAREPSRGIGEEPVFPTSYSKPLTKLNKKEHEEALWRRIWLRSRAERILMNYEMIAQLERPSWTILAYPDEWLIEDDIEKLDVEASLDEGRLRPEVNALKWVELPSKAGHVISSGFAPSAIVLLDSSISMQQGLINAMTSAFIAYLSAKRAGGNIAVVNFSTNFLAGEWHVEDELKELVLSYNLSGYTILPVHEIERLVTIIGDKTFIVIISDCGWQNLREALKRLEALSQKGHMVTIFHMYGWRYKKHLATISKSPHVKVLHVDKPEDLEGLVLREAVSVYGVYPPYYSTGTL